MPMGPGKYDEECTVLREATGAQLCLLMVLNGIKGTGFSVQGYRPRDLQHLPTVLRELAASIEADASQLTGEQG